MYRLLGILAILFAGQNSTSAIVPIWNPGLISSPDSLFCSAPDTLHVNSVTLATYPSGYSVTYKWFSTPGNGKQNALWTLIHGATSPNLTIAYNGSDIAFQRVAILKKCNTTVSAAPGNIISCSLSIPPVVSCIASGSVNFCSGDSVVLLAQAPIGSTITWSDSVVAFNRTIHSSGTYYFSVVDPFGCLAESNTVTINAGKRPTDLDSDGTTDHDDYLLFLTKYSQVCNCQEDFNNDGVVDNYDFLYFLSDYGKGCLP